ncbi:MAG: phosphatidylglycerophosphatase A [Bacteroidia bacterium]
MFLYKTIATFFGIGYIGKGSGTVAAFVVCLFIYACITYNIYSNDAALVVSLLIFIIGALSATQVEKIWEKDSKRIVIDEVFGMLVSLLFLRITLVTIVIAFVLFRFFDIYKPLGIKKAELLPDGWGVMADDLLAGIYANIVLQILCIFIFKK